MIYYCFILHIIWVDHENSKEKDTNFYVGIDYPKRQSRPFY